MTDIIVTLPKNFEYEGKKGIAAWIAEGDAAGDPESDTLYYWGLGGGKPKIKPGERVYVCYNGKLRGYAPLVKIEEGAGRRYYLVRAGNAVAVTILQKIKGFQGFQYRWWDRSEEKPFPEWREP